MGVWSFLWMTSKKWGSFHPELYSPYLYGCGRPRWWHTTTETERVREWFMWMNEVDQTDRPTVITKETGSAFISFYILMLLSLYKRALASSSVASSKNLLFVTTHKWFSNFSLVCAIRVRIVVGWSTVTTVRCGTIQRFSLPVHIRIEMMMINSAYIGQWRILINTNILKKRQINI